MQPQVSKGFRFYGIVVFCQQFRHIKAQCERNKLIFKIDRQYISSKLAKSQEVIISHFLLSQCV